MITRPLTRGVFAGLCFASGVAVTVAERAVAAGLEVAARGIAVPVAERTITAGLEVTASGPTLLFESEIEEQSKTTDIILRAQRSVTVGSSAGVAPGASYVAGGPAGCIDPDGTGCAVAGPGGAGAAESRPLRKRCHGRLPSAPCA